jgi:hypothetical protein
MKQEGKIVSNNFQLLPPRNLDTKVIRNTSGNLEYPLYFSAEMIDGRFNLTTFAPEARTKLVCRAV